MQSEAGAAGAVHGSLQAGALTTTFTASQGLLLMIPNMYKIAGELSPAVFHVAARTVATHALSIFGDHSDVMATRSTGWAMLASGSVQEVHDLALVAHVASLRSRIPFLHFFDGFRTSHEVSRIETIDDGVVRAMVGDDLVADHRDRALSPTHPVLRGTAQNPDVFFQAREASNPFHAAVPGIVEDVMDELAGHIGRRYSLVDYVGHPDAETVLVLMGSGMGPVREVVEARAAAGDRVGAAFVRLFRPFPTEAFVAALPEAVSTVVVLDRTKEPGATGEPLYQDVVATIDRSDRTGVRIVGGRYALSSKEFTPSMVVGVLDAAATAPQGFTIGIHDDVTHLSIPWDDTAWSEPDDVRRAVFHGLGSDGTVGAAKATVKIIADHTDLHAQGYFEYDSKKSGSRTVSHLRISPRPIDSTYLITGAHFVGVHDFGMLVHDNILEAALPGATVLLNSPHPADEVWGNLPEPVQRTIIDRDLTVWAVDAYAIAEDAGLGRRVNTVLQTCFFHLLESDDFPPDVAIPAIKASIEKVYGKRGEAVLRRNFAAVDGAVAGLAAVPIGEVGDTGLAARIPDRAPTFVKEVTAAMLERRGDSLPVSAFAPDGTWPTDTARWEKRSIALEIPTWDEDLCIECARCALVCPHAAIRVKAFDPGHVDLAPDGFKHRIVAKGDLAGQAMTVQVAPDDCTGCGVCVEVCPAVSKESAKHKSIDMVAKTKELLDTERASWTFFARIPERDRSSVNVATVKGSQLLQPLFEFSGACSGCGETPYVKLVSQLFGDRAVIANATGCSSIYGGNLPTTPWAQTVAGFGPAWSNSLFEDNAEFGLGMRLALDQLEDAARAEVAALADDLGDLADELLVADQSDEAGIAAQRRRVDRLLEIIDGRDDPTARRLRSVADHLVKTDGWIIGGDGWAYDIGFGGLDHVLASGRDVNILVLDTEVYSNTGGQASKATPRSAVAKFASGGKATGKKDLGQIAMSYGNVYVGQIAMGANLTQTVRAMVEAEQHPGVSVLIAYSPCIAHGIDMRYQLAHQADATASGHWPLYRYDPALEAKGQPGLRLDSRKPTKPFKAFAEREGRFAMLARVNPDGAEELMAAAQRDIDDRWNLYEQMVHIHRTAVYEEVTE
jgi:pyruvate-ferredoxin/flavodoxin oxidoreductase